VLAFAAVLAYLLVVALKLARLEPELTELEAFGMASRPAEEATPQPAGSDQAAGSGHSPSGAEEPTPSSAS
jgi:hypothetical protein